jgi:hypothetical protein
MDIGDANSPGAAAAEINRLADVAKAKNIPPDDPESFMGVSLRGLAAEVQQSEDLPALLKKHEARIGALASHSQLREVKP